MKFDPDCMRDVLIAAESLTDGMTKEWLVSASHGAVAVDGLSAYPHDTAVYHIRHCAKQGLIQIGSEWIDGSFVVQDLTPSGHLTLSQLRKPRSMQLWSKAKDSGILSSAEAVVSWALGIAGTLLK